MTLNTYDWCLKNDCIKAISQWHAGITFGLKLVFSTKALPNTHVILLELSIYL
jgi:hypothetical protein